MVKLLINNVKVYIYTEKELRHYHQDPFEEGHYWPTSVPGLFFGISGEFDRTRTVLILAGRQVDKIDYAVPQQWWNEQYQKFGCAPNAMWTYEPENPGEEDSRFGRPLYVSTIISEMKDVVSKAVIEWIHAQVYQPEKEKMAEVE